MRLLLALLCAFLVVPPSYAIAIPPGAPLVAAQEDEDSTDVSKLDPAERFIREHLEEYLNPTTIKFLKDGRVNLVFDFMRKKEAHRDIFHQKFGASMKARIRWTVRQEEYIIGGERGIRVSDRGVALINAWFIDDIEAEMSFLQHINHKASQVAAVVFATDKGKMVGSNYGSQAAFVSKSGKATRRRGKTQAVFFDQTGKFKLSLGDGTFEAYRQGRKKAALRYKQKDYTSGRVGFVWGGSIAGTITRFSVTGRLDNKAMVKHLKKALLGQ